MLCSVTLESEPISIDERERERERVHKLNGSHGSLNFNMKRDRETAYFAR